MTKIVHDKPSESSAVNPYDEILVEVGRHIGMRKKEIAKRVLQIGWPGFLIIIPILYAKYNPEIIDRITNPLLFAEIAIPLFILGFLYVAIATEIFNIEKRIWIDSYFDKKDLTPSQTWHMARTLLWPTILVRLQAIVHYYFLETFLFIVAGVCWFYVQSIWQRMPVNLEYPILTTIFVEYGLFIGFCVFIYVTRIRLRFLWFVFLDTWGSPHYKAVKVFRETDRLNTIASGKGFRQAMVVTFGSDSIRVLANISAQSLANGLGAGVSLVNKTAGHIIGGVTGTYGKEYAQQLASLGEIAALYILYREARLAAGKDIAHVNEHLYGLVK